MLSGPDFSAGWVTRAGFQQIMSRDGQHGFRRLRFQHYWDEWMSERLENPLGEVTVPYIRICVKEDRNNIRAAGRNGDGASFAVDAERFGVCIQYLHLRHERGTNQHGQYRKFDQYQGGAINLLGGSARAEAEVDQFLYVAKLYKPAIAL